MENLLLATFVILPILLWGGLIAWFRRIRGAWLCCEDFPTIAVCRSRSGWERQVDISAV